MGPRRDVPFSLYYLQRSQHYTVCITLLGGDTNITDAPGRPLRCLGAGLGGFGYGRRRCLGQFITI